MPSRPAGAGRTSPARGRWLLFVDADARLLPRAVGALWVTAVDFVIDPLAAGPLGYWRWAHAGSYYGIPAANFAGWFVTAFAALLILRPAARPNPSARPVGLSIVIFFTALALAHGLALPALAGCALIAFDLGITYFSASTTEESDGECG